MKYAKAYAGAATVLISFVVLQLGLELPDEVTGAITTLLTGAIVWWVPNKKGAARPRPSVRRLFNGARVLTAAEDEEESADDAQDDEHQDRHACGAG
jgi:hypothetical protein